jgi:hypothetical protein
MMRSPLQHGLSAAIARRGAVWLAHDQQQSASPMPTDAIAWQPRQTAGGGWDSEHRPRAGSEQNRGGSIKVELSLIWRNSTTVFDLAQGEYGYSMTT